MRAGWDWLFRPLDIAWLVYYRIAFGLLMVLEASRYLLRGSVSKLYIEPSFHFTYLGFDWVLPWPGIGMHVHFVALCVVALGIAVGFCYRAAAALFCLGFTYVFLLEQAKYLNHFYLICLLSLFLVFLPAHRAMSFDSLRRPELRSSTVPAWTLWLVRAQLGIVYFYAGIAKLNADWLGGEPMRTWLSRPGRLETPIVGPFLTEEWVVYAASYFALLFDLLVVPGLLWRRTRWIAFGLVLVFHVANTALFDIGIFPPLMIASTLLFFSPSWPRRIPGFASWIDGSVGSRRLAPSTGWLRRLTVVALVSYLAIQLLLPLRHYLYPGDASWTEEGHRFAWRMLLRTKDGWIRFEATEPSTGKIIVIDPREYLTERQAKKMACLPHMILQFSHHLAAELERQGYEDVEIRARARVSLNARPYRSIVDPTVNLAAERRSLWPAKWIEPLEDP